MKKNIVRIEWLCREEALYGYFYELGLEEMAEIIDATVYHIIVNDEAFQS